MKYFFSLVLFAAVSLCSAQKNVLVQNINHRAKELKHNLNTSGDSLVLAGERNIFKVEIFNDDFEKTFYVNKKNFKVPLNNLPLGRFLVEAKLMDKLIVMTLIRSEEIVDSGLNDTTLASATPSANTQSNTKANLLKNEGLKTSLNIPDSDNKTWLNHKIPKSYWVEYLISNGSSSRKTLRFATKEMVERMINKNKLEIQTVNGKLNNLKIWEVYDTTKFLRFKRVNPDFNKIEASEYFNVKPYYSSEYYLASL